jgi:hypothetical protein
MSSSQPTTSIQHDVIAFFIGPDDVFQIDIHIQLAFVPDGHEDFIVDAFGDIAGEFRRFFWVVCIDA